MNNTTTKAAEAATTTTTTTLSWNVDLSKLGIPPSPAAKPGDEGGCQTSSVTPRRDCSLGLPESFDKLDLAVAVMSITSMSFVEKWTLFAVCFLYGRLLTHESLASVTRLGVSTTAQAIRRLVDSFYLAYRDFPGEGRLYFPNAVKISRSRDRGTLSGLARADFDAPFGGCLAWAVWTSRAGLSAVEKWVLVAASTVSHTGFGYTQKGLAKVTGLARSTVNKALLALEAKGWVTSEHHHHGRGGRLLYAANIDSLVAEMYAAGRK